LDVTFKVIELVGTSTESYQAAIDSAVSWLTDERPRLV